MDMHQGQPEISLDGEWGFAFADEAPGAPRRTLEELREAGLELRPCTVPGNFELDLQRNGLINEPFFGMCIAGLSRYEQTHIWYARRFSAEARPGQVAELIFEGVDCFAEIYLNGHHLGSADNMLIEHAFAVDGLLRGDNELVVHLRPAIKEASQHGYPAYLRAINYDSLYVRKAPHMFGWDIMPRALSAGLWRPVRLRYRPVEHLAEVFLETQRITEDRRTATLLLHYRAETHGTSEDRFEVAVEGHCGEAAFAGRERLRFAAGLLYVHVPEPRLWWPKGRGAASLYDVSVTLYKNGELIDRLSFTHGIRTVELLRTSLTDPAGKGEFCFKVNGERVFILGANWVPADAYHSRDAGRITAMLELADELGCNMLRCWGGNVYESELFFDLCDRQGIMIWQDFAMACALYPQDEEFQEKIESEARQVVRRLRRHPCLALWSGDNECDFSWLQAGRDPNDNALTREVLPRVVAEEAGAVPYLPSSPYIDSVARKADDRYLPENHLWGPRDYYKSSYYRESLCHFASEIGYHGCPAPESLRRFLSADKVWPYQNNEEWLLHATSPVPGINMFDYRVELMANQVRELFGRIPETLEEFARASQISQAEAFKFFIEFFRGTKWRRTGLLWWNLIDGWPQFSDAVVDYYFTRKLAYDFIRRAQRPVCLVLREPENWGQDLIACNDTRMDVTLDYRVKDIESGEIMAEGRGLARADSASPLGRIPFSAAWKRFYLIEWTGDGASGVSHYLAGNPPFDLGQYEAWLAKAGLSPRE